MILQTVWIWWNRATLITLVSLSFSVRPQNLGPGGVNSLPSNEISTSSRIMWTWQCFLRCFEYCDTELKTLIISSVCTSSWQVIIKWVLVLILQRRATLTTFASTSLRAALMISVRIKLAGRWSRRCGRGEEQSFSVHQTHQSITNTKPTNLPINY